MAFIDENELSPEAYEEYKRLQTDPIYFHNKFFKIPGEEPYDYQKMIARDVANPNLKELVILKGRQIGASWICGSIADWYATMHEGSKVRIISFNLNQAQRILSFAKTFVSRLKRKGWYDLFIDGERGTNIRWNNNSIVEAHGTTVPEAHNIRGYHADLLFVDEACLIYDRMFPSITPLTIHTGGKTVWLSTAGSIGSFFYRKWIEGNKAEELRNKVKKGIKIDIPAEEIQPIKSYTIPSTECPALTEKDLEKEKASLGEIRFNREYLAQWYGTANQVFTKIPVFNLRKLPTRSKRPCYAGIDVGKINDPTVLIIIEEFLGNMDVIINNVTKNVEIPYRVVYIKSWEREQMRSIAKYIMTSVQPRYSVRLYTIDATGGHGDELMSHMIEENLPVRGLRVKSKQKNELMVGSGGRMGLDEAFMSEKLWINKNINDIQAQELRFELSGYIGKLGGTGYYTFDSTVGRDHMVDALAYAWSSVLAGSLTPFFTIRKRKG